MAARDVARRARTTNPKVMAIPTWVLDPPLTSLTTMAPVPASTRAMVPKASAASLRLVDAVIDLPVDATPDECIEARRTQVDEAIRAGGLPPQLQRYPANVVATIG